MSVYTRSVTTMTVSEARAELPEVLNRVSRGEEITITRHGLPVAVVIHPDALRWRRAHAALADAQRVHELLADAASAAPSAGLTARRAEELVRAIRAGREGR